MRTDQWNILERLVLGESLDTKCALIVNSPWIPPFLGISTIEYITKPGVMFQANLEICERFPEIIFLPGFWVETGMAAEPSGYGCPIECFSDRPPQIRPILNSIDDVEQLRAPNPKKDGIMPNILSQYRALLPMVRNVGMDIKLVAARGPMTLASHLMGVTNFLIGLKTEQEKTHRLMKMLTGTVKEWIEVQAEVLPGVEGYFILDDIMGFLGEEDYLEFAHNYFKDIFSISAKIKILHNNTPNPVSFRYLKDLGVNIFNFSHQLAISNTRKMTGDSIVLMGNISPLDVMVYGSREDVYKTAISCIHKNGSNPRFLLSAGGGVSMGTPQSTIEAIIKALHDSNKTRGSHI